MNWPWRRKPTPAAVQRAEAEAYAEKVHREVIRPLQQMRRENHLTQAVIADIRRNLKENG